MSLLDFEEEPFPSPDWTPKKLLNFSTLFFDEADFPEGPVVGVDSEEVLLGASELTPATAGEDINGAALEFTRASFGYWKTNILRFGE